METKVIPVSTQWIRFPDRPDESVMDLEWLNQGPIWMDPAVENVFKLAEQEFQKDHVVAIPTETVYGLAADARSESAVSKIFTAKQRPSDNPLIVHIASLSMLKSLLPNGEIPESHLPLIQRFWPGPLTLLFPIAPGVLPSIVTAGLSTVAVRFPAHPVARALIHQSGRPLAAPSANSSGRPSPTLASHVFLDLQTRIPLILDAGQCLYGLESTVVSVQKTQSVILRPGGITLEQLRGVPGFQSIQLHSGMVEAHHVPESPGMKYRHYSPKTPVHVAYNTSTSSFMAQVASYLNELPDSGKIGVFLTQTILTDPCDSRIIVFNACHDPSKELFRGLRWLDEQPHLQLIIVEGLKEQDMGRAFMNRVLKAASSVSSLPPN